MAIEVSVDFDASSLSDRDLLDAWATDRCGPALDALVGRYSVMVLSTCRRRCRNLSDADDAFQTTFLYLARSGKEIRDPDRLAGWLQKVAQRASVATLRLHSRETEPMIDTPARPDDPLDRLTQRHEGIVLDEELANLPDRYRTALVLHVLEQETYQSIAARLGTTIGAVHGLVQRGKKMLARRLRLRGVTPVLAIAAAHAWTVSTSAASQAMSQLSHPGSTDALGGDGEPRPTDPSWPQTANHFDFSSLESLLSKGSSTMSFATVTASLAAGGALSLLALVAAPIGVPDGTDASSTITIQAIEPIADETTVVAQVGAMGGSMSGGVTAANTTGVPAVVMGPFGPVLSSAPSPLPGPPAKPRSSVVMPEGVDSDVAKRLLQKMDRPMAWNLSTNLNDLPKALAENLEGPIFLNSRGLKLAGVDPRVTINYTAESEPARAVLRSLLRPLGLRAVIEDDGLVITADMAELTRRGISTDRWLDVSEELADRVDAILDSPISFEFVDTALGDVIEFLSDQTGFRFQADRRALEDLGMSTDDPIDLSVEGISLRSALVSMLNQHDLCYELSNEVILITSEDFAAESRRNRLYFTEGIGFASSDFTQLIELIYNSIEPDTWDSLGGPSTITEVGRTGNEGRPALLIATTTQAHHKIEQLMKALRGPTLD